MDMADERAVIPPESAILSESESAVPLRAQLGARIETAYVGREVRVYGVLQSELNTITMFNTLSTVFFSVGSFLLALGLGFLANAAFAERWPPEGAILAKVGSPLLCLVALICYLIAGWAVRSKRSAWQSICDESKPVIGPSRTPQVPGTPNSSTQAT